MQYYCSERSVHFDWELALFKIFVIFCSNIQDRVNVQNIFHGNYQVTVQCVFSKHCKSLYLSSDVSDTWHCIVKSVWEKCIIDLCTLCTCQPWDANSSVHNALLLWNGLELNQECTCDLCTCFSTEIRVVVVLRSPIHANEPSEYNGMLYRTSNRVLNNGIKALILICMDGTSQYHHHRNKSWRTCTLLSSLLNTCKGEGYFKDVELLILLDKKIPRCMCIIMYDIGLIKIFHVWIIMFHWH